MTPPLSLPTALDWLRYDRRGRAWLNRLPDIVMEASRRWQLRLGHPFEDGYCSLAVPVTDDSGRDAVLKIQFPDRESEHEAAALAAWDGGGAVRLLDHADDLHALLVERCRPGTYLSAVGHDEALAVLVDLLPRLAVPGAGPFTTLADEAAHWATQLPDRWERAGRPFERELVEMALEALDRLAPTQGPQVLVHQDLHPGNVLRAEREPWLVIDPKPLVGELEFAVAPIVRAVELGHDQERTLRRLDHLCSALDLDRSRARDWTFAQTMAWSFEDLTPIESALETARWLLDA